MVKILMLHPQVNDIPSFLRLAMLPDSLAGDLVWEEKSPDVLFASEWIYYKSKYFKKFKKVYGTSGLKVAFLGEALEPDFNLFDYAVGFSDAYPHNPRYIRLPSPFDMFSGFVKIRTNPITGIDAARAELSAKTGFCNFLYSNANANPMRDRLFCEISKYKRVDSLGKHLNNVAVPGTGYGGHSGECTSIKSSYKFSIASENSDLKGYTSEKILTSLEARTVPIYWGNPDVGDDINPACFVNVRQFDGFPALIKEIERIDKDDDLWCRMAGEPWMTRLQASKHEARTADYLSGMKSLLGGSFQQMAPQGYHVYLYRQRLSAGGFPLDSRKVNLRWLKF